MKCLLPLRLVALTVGLLAGAVAGAQPAADKSDGADLVPIRISYQPAYWSLPWFIANDKGWWSKVGLMAQMTLFAAGAAQVAAGASGAWDVGGAGDIPSIIGGAKYGLMNVAISDNENAILTLMAGSAEAAEKYRKSPQAFAGQTIPVTMNSNGERVTAACLEKLGAKTGSFEMVNLAPAAINSAVISKRYELAGVWAPNTYILQSTAGAKVLCRGSDLKMVVTGRLFVTPAYAKERPEAVARFLALYLHVVEWMRQNPAETLAYLKRFNDSVGLKFPDENLPDEVRDHKFLTLDEQLRVFRRDAQGTSEVDRWSNEVAAFAAKSGAIGAIPAPDSYISPKFLEMVNADAKLRRFATSAAN